MPEPRAWQRMLSGRRLDLLNPAPLDVEIADIAHGLAFVARWNGQTKGDYAYSVAEHSLLVEELYTAAHPGQPHWSLAALLHDAPEYVIGDMISPVKAAVGPGYKDLDNRLADAIHQRFGLPGTLPASVKQRIKRADRMSACAEAVQIAGFDQAEAIRLFRPSRGFDPGKTTIRLRPPGAVKSAFLRRFDALMGEMTPRAG